MPGLQCLTQFQRDAAAFDLAIEREAELAVGRKPVILKGIAGIAHILQHTGKILPDKMRQHETVMEGRAPADQRLVVGLFPEPCDQGPQQQLLGQTHFRMRRHLEGPEFDQSEATGRAVRGIKLVDTDFRPVGIARGIDQDIAQNAVQYPGRAIALSPFRDLLKGDFQLEQTVMPGLVNPG